MKNLIKLAVLLVVLAVFAFSTNPTIEKVKNFTLEKGEIVYNWGVEKLANSNNENVQKISELIE